MSSVGPKKKQRQRNPSKPDAGQLSRLDSLRWTSSLPDAGDDDPFSSFAGLNDFEGGVLSLEEIDASEYGLELLEEIPKGGNKQKKQTKRKREESNGDDVVEEEDADGEAVKEAKKSKKKKKKKTKKAKKPEESKDNEEEPVNVANTNEKTDVEEDEVDDSEYHAWYELRLHPLLMKSICRLKFKEPTPIQKACIPAGAHQGKDVIGAAETGSGKTLAFGIPILQRLLDEREKFERQAAERGEADEKIVSKGFLRALIITPTRELALQVTDHLKQMAVGTDVKVVPIVGGMSTEKQERLLKGRPEIVVGTPGRLWELMSGGEIHLVELHSLSFFVLDEADRMIDNGHFQELQSIIDMLPMVREGHAEDTENSLRHLSSLMKILNVNAWTLHAQMQQRARLKAIDRFRGSDHGILVATDVAARGLDIPGVRTVVHYQLPHSAEDKADQSWFQRNAESIELMVDENDSEDERANKIRKKKASSAQLKKLHQELNSLLSRPLQPKTFSSRYLAGAGISPLLQQQFEELAKQKLADFGNRGDTNKRKMVVIGQDCVEPLQALRSSGQEISMDTKGAAEKRRNLDNLRRKRKEDKRRLHDQKRKEKKRLKNGGD
ncbi:hypothetical protein M8C21_013883 [Ambrosia artemisiifolia]|uniref:ATP-dependent RNA helicase n=1 Tax=Ambrosia artemisiifolia TaxID=4212 RepID=A0AAD5GFK9_AMBAR|nr:hypothetical protein M8C21_013883 [Ambrosia artemisiifolia]